MKNEELDSKTIEYVKATSLEKRKQLGQYMTPQSVSSVLLEHLPINNGDKVLDPAVGTGELLKAVQKKVSNVTLYGWDIDKDILQVAHSVVPDAELVHRSGIEKLSDGDKNKYDVVIANPPYFEMKPSDEEKIQYQAVISGRANIFSFFFQQALELVKEEGYIGFIVPPSLNAGAFFKSLRKHILEKSDIVHLEIIRKSDHFVDAQTAVQVIVLKKTKTTSNKSSKFVFSRTLETDTVTVFTENKSSLEKEWIGKKSLKELGYVAITGTIPWNEYKEELTNDKTQGYPLIYAKDISKDHKIVLSEALRSRRYLKTNKRPPIAKKVILVNRIVGALTSPTIRLAKHSGIGNPFYAENHVNVILPYPGSKPEISLDELYDRILANPRLIEYIKNLTGNTQLSAKELTHLIPV